MTLAKSRVCETDRKSWCENHASSFSISSHINNRQFPVFVMLFLLLLLSLLWPVVKSVELTGKRTAL